METPQVTDLEQASAHYRTAGNGLMLLGLINLSVSVIALASEMKNSFIAYDTMALFGFSFIVIGQWMRKQ